MYPRLMHEKKQCIQSTEIGHNTEKTCIINFPPKPQYTQVTSCCLPSRHVSGSQHHHTSGCMAGSAFCNILKFTFIRLFKCSSHKTNTCLHTVENRCLRTSYKTHKTMFLLLSDFKKILNLSCFRAGQNSPNYFYLLNAQIIKEIICIQYSFCFFKVVNVLAYNYLDR